MKLTVKNWGDFQHYKDRAPPWIKLHKGLLDNYEYQCLPLASRALAPMIWLLASESVDGSIDADIAKLAFRLRTTAKEVQEGIAPLIEKGFLIGDSNLLATRKQDACLETEGETEKESMSDSQANTDGVKLSNGKAKFKGDAEIALAYLNEKAGRQYRATQSNLELIAERMKEGASLEDCQRVIEAKCGEWLSDGKMAEYLRPATLFAKQKFWQYEGAAVSAKQTETADWI